MTVSADSRRKEYQGNGVTTIFNGPMAFQRSHIQAFLLNADGMVLVPPANYDVERLGQEAGTRVIMHTAPAVDTELLLLRTMPYTQEVDVTNQGAFHAETIEKGYDALAMQIQQLDDAVGRSLRVQDDMISEVDPLLPAPEPLSIIGWSSDGLGLANYPANELVTAATAGVPFTTNVTAGQTSVPLIGLKTPWSPQGVFYNGIFQGPSAYTYDGSGLTFSEPLPVDGQVVVIAVFGSPTQITESGMMTFKLPSDSSVTRNVQDRLSDQVSVKDFGAAGDGTTDDTTAFAEAAATGKEVMVPTADYVLSSDVYGNFDVQPGTTLVGGVVRPVRRGFWRDAPGSADFHYLRDRVLVGDATKHTGNRFAPLGDSWLTMRGASYFEKNSQMVVLGSEPGKYGMTVGTYCPPSGVASGIGLAAVALNEGVGTTHRALYAEAMHKGSAAATVGVEVQGGNYTATDYSPTAYGVDGGYVGVQVSVAGGEGYVVGDDNTPQVDPTYPATCAVDVSGGSGGANTWQRWRSGIIFRNGSLYRDVDGLTGNAIAIGMAQGHTIEWRASADNVGARLRSDVTDASGEDVGVLFKNNEVHVVGTGEVPLGTFTRDTDGAGGVNYFNLKNSRTGVAPALSSIGPSTNIGVDIVSKGSGAIRLLTHEGAGEALRVSPSGAAGVNYVDVRGGVAGQPVRLRATGPDTNIGLQLSTKGSGVVQFGTHSAVGAETVTGYITIKDSDGIDRKLAVIS